MTAAPDIPEAAVEAAEMAVYREQRDGSGTREIAVAVLAASAPEIARAAKVAGLRDLQRRWEDAPAEVESHTGRAVRLIIAGAFKSAADELDAS